MKYTIISTLFASLLLLVSVQVGFAQTGTGVQRIQINYVTLMNDFSVIGIGGSNLDKATHIELTGTSCPLLTLGKGTFTATYIEMNGLSAQLTPCLTSHRGSTIQVWLEGPSAISNPIQLTIPLEANQIPSTVLNVPSVPSVTDTVAPPATTELETEEMSAEQYYEKYMQNMPPPATAVTDTEGTPVQQPYTEGVDDVAVSETSRCTVNGKDVPCDQVFDAAKTGLKVFGGVLLIIIAVGIACFVFWLWMLIHAISHPIPNKVLWIICFIIFGIITAIVYYFAVKRSYMQPTTQTQVPYTPPPSQQDSGVPPQAQ
jgi:hypothetical protein